MNNFVATIRKAHSTATIWYSYIIGASIVLQESWESMDDYIPKKWRHLILGVITFLVIADKIRRSASRVEDR
jgi:hypothetical protein